VNTGHLTPPPCTPTVPSGSLAEKLQDNSDAKQAEHEEKFKMKNMCYTGMDDDEFEHVEKLAQAEYDRTVERYTHSSHTPHRSPTPPNSIGCRIPPTSHVPSLRTRTRIHVRTPRVSTVDFADTLILGFMIRYKREGDEIKDFRKKLRTTAPEDRVKEPGVKLVVSRSKKGGVSALTSLAGAIRKKKQPAAAAVAVAVRGNVPSGTQAATGKGSASSKEVPPPAAPAGLGGLVAYDSSDDSDDA
jgi:hypothetical protein